MKGPRLAPLHFVAGYFAETDVTGNKKGKDTQQRKHSALYFCAFHKQEQYTCNNKRCRYHNRQEPEKE